MFPEYSYQGKNRQGNLHSTYSSNPAGNKAHKIIPNIERKFANLEGKESY